MYSTVLVGWDGDAGGRDALALARVLARPGARIVAAHVFPFDPAPPGPPAEDWARLLRDEARATLAGVPAGVETRTVPGRSPARALDQVAESIGADLIVVGSSRRGALGRVLAGTAAASLLSGAPCAVAVAPRGFAGDDGPADPRIVLAGFDGSPESVLALRAAEELALAHGAALRVVAVAETGSFARTGAGLGYVDLGAVVEQELRDRLDEALEGVDPAVRADARVLWGDAATVLAEEAERGAGLVVVGSRAFGAIRRVLAGSTSSRLVRLAPCPVLVVPRAAEPAGEEPADPAEPGDHVTVEGTR